MTESADGWIVSRRWRHIVTKEIETGAETPTVGRISTLPSIRGYIDRKLVCFSDDFVGPLGAEFLHFGDVRLTRVADMPGYPTKKALFGGPQTRTKAVIAA